MSRAFVKESDEELAARQMVDSAGTGAVVNISSRSASMTQTMFVAYGAAKAALDRMTCNIAAELAPRVRALVQTVVPVAGLLGQTAATPLRDVLRHFRAEVEAHIDAKVCPAGVCALQPAAVMAA